MLIPESECQADGNHRLIGGRVGPDERRRSRLVCLELVGLQVLPEPTVVRSTTTSHEVVTGDRGVLAVVATGTVVERTGRRREDGIVQVGLVDVHFLVETAPLVDG